MRYTVPNIRGTEATGASHKKLTAAAADNGPRQSIVLCHNREYTFQSSVMRARSQQRVMQMGFGIES